MKAIWDKYKQHVYDVLKAILGAVLASMATAILHAIAGIDFNAIIHNSVNVAAAVIAVKYKRT